MAVLVAWKTPSSEEKNAGNFLNARVRVCVCGGVCVIYSHSYIFVLVLLAIQKRKERARVPMPALAGENPSPIAAPLTAHTSPTPLRQRPVVGALCAHTGLRGFPRLRRR